MLLYYTNVPDLSMHNIHCYAFYVDLHKELIICKEKPRYYLHAAKEVPEIFYSPFLYDRLSQTQKKKRSVIHMAIALGSVAIVIGIGAAIYFAIKKWG